MRKHLIIGIGLVAMLGFGAVAATAAITTDKVVESTVTVRYIAPTDPYDESSARFRGRIISSKDFCKRARAVTITQLGGPTLGTITTGKKGRFGLSSAAAPGFYRAKAATKQQTINERTGRKLICPKAKAVVSVG